MNTIKLHLKPGIGADNLVEVDGKDLAHMVRSIELFFAAGNIPELKLTADIVDCEVNGEGIVSFNGIPISDDIARQVYLALKEKFEQ